MAELVPQKYPTNWFSAANKTNESAVHCFKLGEQSLLVAWQPQGDILFYSLESVSCHSFTILFTLSLWK